MRRVSHALDRIDVTFDDPNLVADAGLLLVATLSQRLGLEALINSTLRLVGRVGGSRPGRKVLTLVTQCARTRPTSITRTSFVPVPRAESWDIG